jgi:hypothetical protein
MKNCRGCSLNGWCIAFLFGVRNCYLLLYLMPSCVKLICDGFLFFSFDKCEGEEEEAEADEEAYR